MSNPIDVTWKVELHDSSGTTLGSFVAESIVTELIAERDRLRNQVAEQQAEIERLKELAGQVGQPRSA